MVQNAAVQLVRLSLADRDLTSMPWEPSWTTTPRAFIRVPIRKTTTQPTATATGSESIGNRFATASKIPSSTHRTATATSESVSDGSDAERR